MDVSIVNIHKATFDEWDRIWQKCDYATYFHSREWAEIWHEYSNGRIQPYGLIVEFNDKKSAILPLSREKQFHGLLADYISSPAGTFGGWIAESELTGQHVELMIRYFLTNLPNLTWRLNPYHHALGSLKMQMLKDSTLAIRLTDGFDRIFKRWSEGHRRAAKKAINLGVTARIASSLTDWESYYAVYKDSMCRWGDRLTSSYDWKLFKIMFDRNSNAIKLWLAEYEGRVIAGVLCFYSMKHVAYWHGASLQEFFRVRPANLLMYEAIKNACGRGYVWFDFNPSGGHKGVEKFKEGFGCIRLDCDLLIKKSLISRYYKIFRAKIKGCLVNCI